MGCSPCCAEHAESEGHADGNPGPDNQRKCTDPCCIVAMVIAMSAFAALLGYLISVSSTDVLTHGHDHYRNMCGRGDSPSDMKSRKMVYFPDLQKDFQKDPTLRAHYGVCVRACPQQGDIIPDYDGSTPPGEESRRKVWFASLPTFNLVGRCIPYEPTPNISSVTQMCAYPQCNQSTAAAQHLQVCGLERDGTDKYWLLSKPDVTLVEGWRTEILGGDPSWKADALQLLIDARVKQAESISDNIKTTCEVVVQRGLSVAMMPTEDQQILYQVLTKYTGLVFRWGSAVYRQRLLVFGLGIGGALLSSFLVICLMTCFARCIIIVLLIIMFTVLIALDYILFTQAGIISGSAGLRVIHAFENAIELDVVPNEFESMLAKSADTESLLNIYKWGAFIVAVLIFLLACVVCAVWRNVEILIALLQEASKTIREMPSLLVFPFCGLISALVTSYLFLCMLFGLSTTDASDLEPLLKFWKSNVEPILALLQLQGEDSFQQMRQTLMWSVVFGFLWAYFFHVAMFISIVAFAVSHWYFYRNDPERNAGTGIHSDGWFPGRPVLLATFRLCRYHTGTMAVGSFIMALATMPRIIFEYIVHQSGLEQTENQVTKAIIWATRCILWCLRKCLRFLTEYAYVYVAVTGRPFCASARSSFGLFAKYPVQVSLDKMACTALGFLACVTVPAGMVALSYVFVKFDWMPCAIVIAGLSYITTRLTVGVYDVCVTTLFVCCMRDQEHYDGKYMSDGLRSACGFSKQEDDHRRSRANTKSQVGHIELRPSVKHGQPPGSEPQQWGHHSVSMHS